MLAGWLRHHPAWSAAELAADLASARDRLELMHTENLSVAAAFDLSYQDLAPAQQRLFRRLGWHVGTDFDLYAAAALDDADLASTRRCLEVLYDQHLLTEPIRGRYRLHDLMREHARSLAAEDRDAAEGRLLGYYLHAARTAGQHLARRSVRADLAPAQTPVPDLTEREAAIRWLERERSNLHAAAAEAVQRHRPEFATGLAAALHGYLRFQGYWDQALAMHRAALDCAAGDRRAQAQALANLGDVQLATRDYPAAVTSLSRAIGLHRDLADQPGEAAALTQLGAALYLTGDNEAAAGRLTEALALHRELGDRLAEAIVLSRLGSVQLVTGDYPAATAGLTRALTLYRELGDRLGEAHALNDLGAVRQATGEYAKASGELTRALGIYAELGDRLGQANALLVLGDVQRATGDYEAANSGLSRALDLYAELGDRLGRANVLHQLGAVRQAVGDHVGGTDSQQEALKLYREIGDRSGEADALIDLAEVSLAEVSLAEVSPAPNTAPARGYFEQALAIATEIASPLTQARALEGLGRCDRRDGQPGTAKLREALAIYQRIGSPRAQATARLLQ
jgi:tetratricopeptide (TPR) repeat protein